jgi:ABC-type transport system substrate-binding protein
MNRRGRFGVSVVACLGAALIVLLGASAAPVANGRFGGTLVVGETHGLPDTLDPSANQSFASILVFRAIAERLYDTDARGNVYPELASALPTISRNKLMYTIPLRTSVLFNDGTPFNALAVVVSLDRDLTLPNASHSTDFPPGLSVDASGPYTAQIHLKARFRPLLQTLATLDSIVMSPTQLQKLGANFGSDPIGVGPFMYDSQVPGVSVTVIKVALLLRQGGRPPRQDLVRIHEQRGIRRGSASGRRHPDARQRRPHPTSRAHLRFEIPPDQGVLVRVERHSAQHARLDAR